MCIYHYVAKRDLMICSREILLNIQDTLSRYFYFIVIHIKCTAGRRSLAVPFIYWNPTLTPFGSNFYIRYIFRVIFATRKAHLTLSMLAVRGTKKTQRVDTSRGAKPTLFVGDQSRLCPVMRLTLRSERARGPRDCFINVSMIRGERGNSPDISFFV